MNKNQITFAVIGGVAAVASIALGVVLLNAMGAKSELLDDLESSSGSYGSAVGGKLAPSQANVDVFTANAQLVADWTGDALGEVVAGDRAVDRGMTSAAFKQMMGDDARALAQLPGRAEGGTIVKADFTFGFEQFIKGGAMPDQAKLPELQRQWADVKLIVRSLADAGAYELLEIGVVEKPAEPESRPNGRRAQKKGQQEEEREALSSETYLVKFRVSPSALVAVLNALETDRRFMTVDDFTLVRTTDAIGTALGAARKEQGAESRRTSRRGRRAQAEATEAEAEAKGLVTDPLADSEFTVTAKVSTYDFGTKEEQK